MVTKFKIIWQRLISQEHRYIVCLDGAVFPQPLWGSEQEEPFGIQGYW